MSERTRAKEALRSEVNTYTGENVRKIAATTSQAEEDRVLRVAAYCRVSTDDIDQLVSIEMQKNNYASKLSRSASVSRTKSDESSKRIVQVKSSFSMPP